MKHLILAWLAWPFALDSKATIHREIYRRVKDDVEKFKLALGDQELLDIYSKLELFFPHGTLTPAAVKVDRALVRKYARTSLLLARGKKISPRHLEEFKSRVYKRKDNEN